MEGSRIEGLPRRRRAPQVTTARRGSARAATGGRAPARAFSTALVEADRRRYQEALQLALEQVERAGDALRRSPGESTLFAYRQAVRRFCQLALARTYAVDRQLRVDPRGGRRLHVVVRKVDEALDQLAREVLQGQRAALAVAARLDDIRGLLLDLVR
ncbi:MAG: YaaR family protein [Firmicutes bacterium]|nr:YaaR family protein [Bacillota bacterium]